MFAQILRLRGHAASAAGRTTTSAKDGEEERSAQYSSRNQAEGQMNTHRQLHKNLTIWAHVWQSWGPAKQQVKTDAWKIQGPVRSTAMAEFGIEGFCDEIARVKAEHGEVYEKCIHVSNQERGVGVAPEEPTSGVQGLTRGIRRCAECGGRSRRRTFSGL